MKAVHPKKISRQPRTAIERGQTEPPVWRHRPIKRWGCVLLALGVMLAGGVTKAQTYLIDFGGGTTTTRGPAPDDPDNYWNNVTSTLGATPNAVLAGLVTTRNNASAINLVIVSPFNGANENGTVASLAYPVNATRDSLYGNTEIWSGKENIYPKFKLTGLDAATQYTLTFYASRMASNDNRETEYTVTGAATAVAVLDAANNVDATVTVADVIPDAAGEITIAMAPSPNNNNAYHFTYLGVLQIDAVPPQTPLAFTEEPVSQRIVQLKPVTFTCAVSGPPPYFIQWYENGNPIYQAHDFSYTIPSVDLAQDGYTYSVTVSNLQYGVASSNAVLTVLSDTNPPVLLSAVSYDGTHIQLTFDEILDYGSALDGQNYAVNAGAVTVAGVDHQWESRLVTLTLAAPVSGTFTVTVSNIKDVAGNMITPNTRVTGQAVAIEDQDLLFDFGGNGNPTEFGPAPHDPKNYWNNIPAAIGTSDAGILSGAVTVFNTPTEIALVILRRFNGANENGTLESAVFPSKATQDSLFGNTEAFGAGANFFPQFKLTGLNPARQYTLTFYASRMGVSDNRDTGYTVEGATSDFTSLNAANNINNLTRVVGMAPTAAGEITVSLAPTPQNNNANHFTYLGVLRVSPYVAPLQFQPVQLSEGKVLLDWTGEGQLEWAPSITGPWTAVEPAPVPPYQEELVPGGSRFYRLKQ